MQVKPCNLGCVALILKVAILKFLGRLRDRKYPQLQQFRGGKSEEPQKTRLDVSTTWYVFSTIQKLRKHYSATRHSVASEAAAAIESADNRTNQIGR